MNVLISGAAGFIGSHLCERFLVEGHKVTGIDNFITGSPQNLAHLNDLIFHQADATALDFVQKMDALGPFDLVLHLASLASPKDYLNYPIETLESGSTATRNMLEVAKLFQARFLLTSTSECYGDPLEHPQKESYWGNVNPIGPRSCYDESKRFAEALTMAYHRKFGLRTNIARIFNTYGPRMKLDDGRVVPAFLSQALKGLPLTVFGDGTQTRSFCYVDDLVEGLCRLMLSEEREPVNLGNPEEITLLEFAERIQRLLGTTSPLEFHPLPENDPTRRQPDISKAKRVLNWEPKIGLEEGLTLTVKALRDADNQSNS
ncbi:MAG: SDR family oxidoreductase [Acidobacteria bacterium]|nr:SDR family oxidoreductase [Acidobacteriota bacterium]